MRPLLAQVAVPDAVKPALTTVESTILGALLIVAVITAVGAIILLVRVQNARVLDQKALSDKSEGLMSRMITAFTDMKSTIESLKTTLEGLKGAEQETQKALNNQQRAFELTLLMGGAKKRDESDPPPPKKGKVA
jgi:uncharacterized protein HemX